MNIEMNIRKYIYGTGEIEEVQPNERHFSFDYCFNYFQSFREKNIVSKLAETEYIQMSCLQIGFFLASWGMYRGSAYLHKKNAKFLEPLIEYIATAPGELWEIDANRYSMADIKTLLECKRQIGQALHPCSLTDTLAAKIMLGVFGNVPAFDSKFTKGFEVSTFNQNALDKIHRFYLENSDIIESNRIPTIDFHTGNQTKRSYTRAKVIDMIFYIEGS